jgi:hypothetical protein
LNALASAALLYNHGFKSPNDGRPFEIRSLFNKATTAANAGQDALVPDSGTIAPSSMVIKLTPWAEILGYARLEELKYLV